MIAWIIYIYIMKFWEIRYKSLMIQTYLMSYNKISFLFKFAYYIMKY